MNQMNFFKYQGTGNDFIILDNRNWSFTALTTERVKALCDRRFGIGADGLMLLNPRTGYDFEMKYYNSDGRESSMCGNGGRCLGQQTDRAQQRDDARHVFRHVHLPTRESNWESQT